MVDVVASVVPGPDRVGSDPWWMAFKANPQAQFRLFCFPYAGGNASVYRTWHCEMPENTEVCALQLPGRGSRVGEPPLAHVPTLVSAVGAGILPLLDRPFAFFGHSLGALLSFELSRWLRRYQGVLPKHLFVSGCRAPNVRGRQLGTTDLNDEQFVGLLDDLRGTPREVLENRELLELLLPALRADFQLGETYAYRDDAPLPFSITAFGGVDDEDTAGDRLAAWRRHTTGRFLAHVLPGDHFFIQSSERQLLALVRSELRALVAAGRSTAR